MHWWRNRRHGLAPYRPPGHQPSARLSVFLSRPCPGALVEKPEARPGAVQTSRPPAEHASVGVLVALVAFAGESGQATRQAGARDLPHEAGATVTLTLRP